MTTNDGKPFRTSAAPPENAAAKNAGRGGVAVLGAKVFFVFGGLAQQICFPLVIGKEGYGRFALVAVVGNVVNNVVVAASTQSVSRTLASGGDAWARLRATFRVHAPLAVGMSLLVLLAAPFYAAFEHNPGLRAPLFVMAGVTLAYGLYAPLIGAMNGVGRFATQARLDATFTALRTAGMLGVGYVVGKAFGEPVLGVVLGFVGAAVLITALAFVAVRKLPEFASGASDAADTTILPGPYFGLIARLAAVQLFTNLLMQADLTLLGRFSAIAAPLAQCSTSMTDDAMAACRALSLKESDEWVGVYRACQLFAFLPYQLVLSITQILFPALASARAANDTAAVTRYVVLGARLSAAFTCVLVAVVAAIPGSLLNLTFGHEIAARGAEPLRILAIGQAAFTLFGIASSVLAGLGKERLGAALAAGGGILVAATASVIARVAPFGEPMLLATAYATSSALGIALVAASVAVKRVAGGFLPLRTVVVVGSVLAAAVAVGTRIPILGKAPTLAVAPVIAIVAAGILVATRELDPKLLREARGK